MKHHEIEDLSRSELEKLIDEYVHHARNRDILKRRLFDGALYTEIATEFHLDYDYTRKLIHKEEDKLFRKIEKRR